MRPFCITCAIRLALVSLLAFGSLSTAVRSQELREVSRAGEKAILAKPGLQMTGARKPDVTIVEYFDYNCPFCKRVVPTFKQLLAEDKKLAIVYKDWPVLGESSGTPGIMVGRQLMPGGADVDFFRKLIAAVRREPK